MTLSPSAYLKTISSQKPANLNPTNTILSPTPHALFIHQPFSVQEQQSYDERSINYVVSKYKREFKWNVDVDDNAQGDFDAECNFVIREKTSNKGAVKCVLWMIAGLQDGPFTTDEMILKLEMGELTGKSVKRVDDGEYMPVADLMSLEGTFENKEIDELFVKLGELKIKQNKEMENVIVEKKVVESKKGVKNPNAQAMAKSVQKVTKTGLQLSEEDKGLLEHSCPKSKAFLARHECSLGLVELVEALKKKDRREGVLYLKKTSKMNEADCLDFFDLVISESRIGICKMDGDGFEKVSKMNKRK